MSKFHFDIKNTWKILNQVMNIQNKKVEIDQIKSDDNLINDSFDIANVFNSYFSQIGETLAKDIPATELNFTEFLGQCNSNSIFFYSNE